MLKIIFILYALGMGWFLYKLLPEQTNQDDEDTLRDTMGINSTSDNVPTVTGTVKDRLD
jgi:hypothetical protein